ncbi:hypothetical protein ACHAQH_000716 [Verticillium albo-atrum]
MGVMYHDTGEESKGSNRIIPALVLEYAEYGNLKEFQLSGHATSFSDQIKVALDAATGIQALHQVGMIHGDVKPSNFLVCKHPSRGFVVKLADFGFSLSIEDGKFIGHTQMYCAPESYDGNFERQYLKQLDLYSYGLTFLTILESGGTFYDNLPPQDLDTNVRKMKTADLMCTSITIRILKGTKNEGRPLAIICKILKMCLQQSPVERFKDMNRVILLLRLVEKVAHQNDSIAPFDHTTAPQAIEAIDFIGGHVGDHISEAPSALQQGYPECLAHIRTALEALPKQQPARLSQLEAKMLRDQAARIAQMTLWLHSFVTNTQKKPLGAITHQVLEKKVISDLFEAVGTPGDKSDEILTFDTRKTFAFLADLIGLLPEPHVVGRLEVSPEADIAKNENEAKKRLTLSRYLDFIPDLAASFATIRKMPWIVQVEVIHSIEEVFEATTDTVLKASAAFNLSIAYTQGTGVMWDLTTARKYLFQAATLGMEEAQTLYINIFASYGTNVLLPESPVWLHWLEVSAMKGNRRAFEILQDLLLSLGVDFVEEIRKTIATLVSHGAPTDAVLEVGEFKMPAVFAVAEHQCFAEVMIAGLENGFAKEIDAFPQRDKRHNALLMAINHRDHMMVRALLNAGASTTVKDTHGQSPLERAAKESDDVFFVRSILETGISAQSVGPSQPSAFETAVYTGNFKVAQFLFNAGAERDRVNTAGRTIMGEMILLHTRNALERIKFLLSLPDRDGQDGFVVQHSTSRPISALRFAVLRCKEADPTSQYADITDMMIACLIEKYDTKIYFDSTDGAGHMAALTAAVGLGNHRVVKRLLEKGADPNIADDKERTAMSLVRHRYLYPESVGLLAEYDAAHLDRGTAERLCRRVNENTSELVRVLVSYGAAGDEGKIPDWYKGEKGYKCVHCVMEALRGKLDQGNG